MTIRNALKNFLRAPRGQAVTELALFGAVLIFLLGGIIRSALSMGYDQNMQIKAMRQALLDSYTGSLADTVGRNTASNLYIEDRLSPDISKYGSNERIQLLAQGQGTLTKMLLYPLDPGELANPNNLPVLDLYVNGTHFALSQARFVTKTYSSTDTVPLTYVPPAGAGLTPYLDSYNGPLPALPHGLTRYRGWEFNCVVQGGVTYGCPILYTLSIDPGDYGILTEEEAYDLNRNDDFTDDPGITARPGMAARSAMAWHWKGLKGTSDNISIDSEGANYPTFDIDSDGQEETIYLPVYNAQGILISAGVVDHQEGDLDMTAGEESNNNRIKPGLQNEMFIFTRTREGTYLLVKEGKLYNPENIPLAVTFVRSINKADQVELVQRMFQLSNDTGRLCDGASNPVANSGVEACHKAVNTSENCFSRNKIELTCFDQDQKMLYIRSRVLDKRGHYWITRTPGGFF